MESFSEVSRLEMKSKINQSGEVLKIKIFGHFKHSDTSDQDIIVAFNKQITSLIKRAENYSAKPKFVVIIDMKKCHYINSTGLSCIISAYHLIGQNDGQLHIINIIDKIMSMFEEMKLVTVVDSQPLSKKRKYIKKPLTEK